MKPTVTVIFLWAASLIATVAVSFWAYGCGSSVGDLPISDSQKIAIAIETGCMAAASAGCLDDAETNEVIISIIGAEIKTSAECVSAVTQAVETQIIAIDVGALTRRRMTCSRFAGALIKKIPAE